MSEIYDKSNLIASLVMVSNEINALKQSVEEARIAISSSELSFRKISHAIAEERENLRRMLNDESVIALFAQELNRMVELRQALEAENQKLAEKLSLIVSPKKRGFFR